MSKEKIVSHTKKEYLESDNTHYTLAMIKPDGVQKGVYREFEELLREHELEIVMVFPVVLDRDSIYQTFEVLRKPSEFGDDWKEDVINALSESPNIVYLITGNDVVARTLSIRNQIRERHTDRKLYSHRVVKNLLHASDTFQEAQAELAVLSNCIDYEQIEKNIQFQEDLLWYQFYLRITQAAKE